MTRPIVYIHVPKCAGTAIHELMLQNVGPAAFYKKHWTDEEAFKTHSLHPKMLFKKHAKAGPQRKEELIQPFLGLNAYGGHSDIRILDVLRLQEPFTFTSFRDPMDRLVSFYFHYVHPDKPSYFREFREQLQGASFREFLEFPDMVTAVDNMFVRVFSGHALLDRVTETQLERAKENLHRLDAIVYQDRLEEDLKALCARLGWSIPPDFFAARIKEGGTRKKLEAKTPMSREDAAPFIELDDALFAYSRTLRHLHLSPGHATDA